MSEEQPKNQPVESAEPAEPVEPAASKAPTTKGKRYNPEERKEILDFIASYNKKNKRGGLKTASKKYKVSAVSISRWMKSSDKPDKKKGRKPGRKPGRKAAARVSSGDIGKTLARLGELHGQIESLQAEYDAVKKSL